MEALQEGTKYQVGYGRLLEGSKFYELAWSLVPMSQAEKPMAYYSTPKEFTLELMANK